MYLHSRENTIIYFLRIKTPHDKLCVFFLEKERFQFLSVMLVLAIRWLAIELACMKVRFSTVGGKVTLQLVVLLLSINSQFVTKLSNSIKLVFIRTAF